MKPNPVISDLRKRVKALERSQLALRQGVMNGPDSVLIAGAGAVAKEPILVVGGAEEGDRVSVLMAGLDAIALSPSDGAVPTAGSIDGRTARILVRPVGTSENGVIVKAPSSTWKDNDYGEAQAFMLLREDYAADPGYGDNVEPDKNVLFRVNGHDGGIGTTGGLHSAIGARQHPDFVALQNVWLDQTAHDCVGIVITSFEDPTKHWILCNTPDGQAVFQVTPEGWLASRAVAGLPGVMAVTRGGSNTNPVMLLQEETAGGTIADSAVGDGVSRVFSAASRYLFGAGSTHLFSAYVLGSYAVLGHVSDGGQFALAHNAAGETQINAKSGQAIIFKNNGTEVARVGQFATKIANILELVESAGGVPSAAPSDGAYLYLADDGAGNTQLGVRFHTGAAKVLATEADDFLDVVLGANTAVTNAATAVQSHTITAAEAGVYSVSLTADVSVTTAGVGVVSTYAAKNGTIIGGAAQSSPATTDRRTVPGGLARVTLAAGDVLAIYTQKSINAGVATLNASSTRLHAERVT